MTEFRNVPPSLSSKIEIRVIEEVKRFLGIVMNHNRENTNIKAHNAPVISATLAKFNMSKCKPKSTPLQACRPLIESQNEYFQHAERMAYREAVGILIYVANMIQTDIAFEGSRFARFM